MIQQNLTIHDLGRRAGLSSRTISNLLANSFVNSRARWRLEKVFNLAIWSTHEEHMRRLALERFLGFDPCLAKFRRLQLTAKDLRIVGWTKATKKRELISLLGDQLLKQKKPVRAGRSARGRIRKKGE